MRDGLKPVIFLLNKEGYNIKRAIRSPEQRYNDIAQCNWTLLLQALANEHPVQTLHVTEPEQLQQALLEVADFRQLAFIKVLLPKMDIPELLSFISRAIQKSNTVL